MDKKDREEKILKFWQENNIFEKSLEQTKNGKPFVFYDGPPFATGLPHYGHLVGTTMKDVVPRYQTMRGRHVERKWGWDCHGLPIENIVEKELGTKSKKEIEEIGIGKFNSLCREKIFTFVDEWNKFIPRFGRWADMDNPYRTMDASYMESEWWAFKKLYDKGLIYKDYRSMHICPRCETTLAQSEVAEGYKDIKDISVTAKFELITDSQQSTTDNEKTYILAWTTTPWTLPGNVALAVGKEIDYVVARVSRGQSSRSPQGGERSVLKERARFILAKDRIKDIFKDTEYEITDELKGKDLVGKAYKPLFDDYAKDETLENRENGWKIYSADFVNTKEGTGIVHIAPAFGEDDMELGKKEKLPFVQHVSMDGIIKPEIKELAGLSVKPKDDHQATDIEIIKLLAGKNLLFSKEKITHSYPHCWRCDTPLLNYATSSWFVSVTKIKKDLLKYAKKINWSPANMKEGRWADWLAGARDWSISRQRFWANTIPVWECGSCKKRKVAGSIDDIKKQGVKSGNTYFVMRHGQADHNVTGILSGKADNEHHLTEMGEEQVTKTAQSLKKKKIDMIFASPFVRTKETVAIVAKKIGISSESIIYDERLKELWTGEMEGKSVEVYISFVGSQLGRFTNRPKGGETAYEIKRRVMDLLYEIEQTHSGKNILIVTHETPGWLLLVGAQGATPLEAVDLWEDDMEAIATGSVQEFSFVPLPHNKEYELDLHRPYIDEILFTCSCGASMKRVTDVLDTWFDSGSVPFSSYHYPFENKRKVEGRIPADFIAEGQDQVSKWFYYQHVLSGGLFKKHAFSNVIVNGIVLAEDGKKMSKRLQNYPDPVLVVDKFGADAVRFYLLSSPVVRAENLTFSEKGVDEVYKKNILRLDNVVSFYEMYDSALQHKALGSSTPKSENVLDQWIVARLSELTKEITKAMDSYELDKATRPITDFIDDLSTWYIRRSRGRFKDSHDDKNDDKKTALQTTNYILIAFSKIIAPFMPFTAEDIYKRADGGKDNPHTTDADARSAESGFRESVHLESWPKPEKINKEIIEEMEEVRKIVSLGLEARAKAGIKVRQPLALLKIQNPKSKIQNNEQMIQLIKDEVNVKKIIFDENATSANNEVELDTKITLALEREGNARDLLRQIQELRKKEGLQTNDHIVMYVETSAIGKELINKFEQIIKNTALISNIVYKDVRDGHNVEIGENTFIINIENNE